MASVVRDARREDASDVAELLHELGYPSTSEAAARHIERFSKEQSSRLQVAEGTDCLLGLVATHIVPRLDDDELTCRITDIVVRATHRRSGIGTQLFNAAAEHAQAAGAPRLDLSSGEWRTDAHAFYLAHGFQARSSGSPSTSPKIP
ncbi:MAG: GNAT family N-acetyltransferase [Solirubrobacterales bacterium]|nr:GNAT family N-acetyltransferase [Solirubrobacterales bacterium]